MPEGRLHLDANTSSKMLYGALLDLGHDVTRTPNPWMPADASDEVQLLGATAQGRCVFTFNIRDFVNLAERYPSHGGLLLAAQKSWTPSLLISAVDRVLRENDASHWPGQVRWLERP